MAELVAERHEHQPARPRLDVLLGDVCLTPSEDAGQHGPEGLHGELDGDVVQGRLQQFRGSGGVFEALGQGMGRGHHHAAHPRRAQRVDGNGRREGAVDAPRQAEDDPRKTVLIDVVPEPRHHGPVDGLQALGAGLDGRRLAYPVFAGSASPQGEQHLRAPRRGLGEQHAIGAQYERRAVEHHLVLTAHQVDVNQRQSAFLDPCHGMVKTLVELVTLERRAVEHDQDLGSRFHQALGDVGNPHVLAHHDAEPHSTEGYGSGQGAGGEDALLIEHAVVGQLMFETDGGDLAAVEQQRRVVELAVLAPRRAQQERRAAVTSLGGEPRQACLDALLKGRLENQVLGRVAGYRKLPKGHQIGATVGGLTSRRAHQFRVAVDVADDRVDLRQGDGEGFNHGDVDQPTNEPQRCPGGGTLGGA